MMKGLSFVIWNKIRLCFKSHMGTEKVSYSYYIKTRGIEGPHTTFVDLYE